MFRVAKRPSFEIRFGFSKLTYTVMEFEVTLVILRLKPESGFSAKFVS